MTRTPTIIRWNPDDLAKIGAAAKLANVPRSVFIVDAAVAAAHRSETIEGIQTGLTQAKRYLEGDREGFVTHMPKPAKQTPRTKPKLDLSRVDIADGPVRPKPGTMLKVRKAKP